MKFILKQQYEYSNSEWEHPFFNIRCPCCEAERAKTLPSRVPFIIIDCSKAPAVAVILLG